MRSYSLLALAASTPVLADYMCPVMPGSSDLPAIVFGYAIQELLNSYYASVPINESFYSSLPSPTVPMTDFLANTMGLGVQAKIGADALMATGKSAGATMPPKCDFMYPPVTNATSHLMNAYMIEATLCGAFIGLADYVQSPQAAFLMARLAAEHGIHASYIGSHMKPVVFPDNSTSLTPAFTPAQIASSGMDVGYLGQYLNGCVKPPSAPCGGEVQITMTGAMLENQMSGSSNMSMSGSGSGSAMASGSSSSSAMSPTMSPQAFTGGASAGIRDGAGVKVAVAVVAAAAAVAFMM